MGAYVFEVGDLVKRKPSGYEGRVEWMDTLKRAVHVRSGGTLYELAPDEVELLARRHPCGRLESHPISECNEEVTHAGIAAGHTFPYETCAKCHPAQQTRLTKDELAAKLLEQAINAPPPRLGQPFTHPVEIPVECLPVIKPGAGPTDQADSDFAKQLMETLNAPMDERTRMVRDAMIYGSAVMAVDWGREYLAAEHNREGYCEVCRWSYCRVPEVKREPRIRCAGCAVGAETLNFQGGGCFDYPLEAGSEENPAGIPDSSDCRPGLAGSAQTGEEENLCPACAAKVAAFIKHLRDTHGGRR